MNSDTRYQRAVSNNGDTAFTTAYKDTVTGREVISLSKVIYEGRYGMRNSIVH